MSGVRFGGGQVESEKFSSIMVSFIITLPNLWIVENHRNSKNDQEKKSSWQLLSDFYVFIYIYIYITIFNPYINFLS